MMYENDTDNSKLLLFPLIQPFYAVIRRFFDIIVVLFILNIIKGNTKNAFLLLFSIGVFFLMPLLSGSRGGVVINSIKIVGYYLLLSSLLSKNIKKAFRTFGFLLFIILIVGFVLISVSRFSNMDSGDRLIQQWISQYIGEGFVRFSDTIWDLKRTLDGNKNFPFFKSLLGYDVILDNDKAIDVYSAYIGTKTNVFYTFIGSFYLDFGRLGNIIWFIFLGVFSYLIINRINKTNAINFIEIFYIIYLYNLCAVGFTANPYAISHTQKDITVQFILIGVIYILSKRKGVTHLQTS